MRPFEVKRGLGALLLLATAGLLSGCDMALMSPKGQVGLEQKSLILTALGLMLIVVIPVIIMTVAFARKYRASNTTAKYTPDWSHSNKIEAVVWTVPVIIVAILAVITWKTSHSLDPYKPLVDLWIEEDTTNWRKCVLSRGSEQNGHRNLSRMVTRPERRYRAFPCMRACLTRYDSPRNCRSLPWCTTRSITAAAIWSSPKTEPHLENSRLVVNTTDCLS